MQQPTIRRADRSDAQVLSDLGARTFAETFAHLYPPQDLADFLAQAYGLEKTLADLADPAKAQWLVEADGQAQLRVELESVSSGIPKRHELLRKDLFEIGRFPLALIGTRLDLPSLLNLAPGAQLELNVPLTVKPHGQVSDHLVELLVTRLDEQRFQVVTLAPLVLQAEDYDLLPGLEKLRQLANLSHINSAVPVSAVLIFVNR